MTPVTTPSNKIVRPYLIILCATIFSLFMLVSSVWGEAFSASPSYASEKNQSTPLRQLRLTIIEDGQTENRLVRMKLYGQHPENLETVEVPLFELASNGTDAVGYNTLQIAEGYYRFYMWGPDTATSPLAKSVIHVDGDLDITIRIHTPPEDYGWFGGSIDFNELEPPYTFTQEGATVEISAAALEDTNAFGGSITADIEDVLITEAYTLLAYQYWLSIYTDSSTYVKFSDPVTVTLPYDLEGMAENISPEDLRISLAYGSTFGLIDNPEWNYRPSLVVPDSVDVENQTVTFTIEEEGTFGIVVPVSGLDLSFNFFEHNLFLPLMH